MKLISWNVNGIRANIKKGFLDFIYSHSPDIICLQEIKAQASQVPELLLLEQKGYYIYTYSAERPGYSGTAIFSKKKPIDVLYGMGESEHDTEGRVITTEFEDYFLITVYTPNAKNDLSRLEYRQRWDRFFFDYCKNLEEKKPVIICGDLNVAYADIDLARPKPNRWKAGFTNEERAGLQYGYNLWFVDTFRHLHPDQTDAYTWWSYFGKARENNVGWRIDYFLCSSKFTKNIKKAFILPEAYSSDHCPVGIEI